MWIGLGRVAASSRARRQKCRSSLLKSPAARRPTECGGWSWGDDRHQAFSLRELRQRAGGCCAARAAPEVREAAFGDVRVQPGAGRVTRAAREVRLTRKAYDLLVYMA